MLSSCGKTASKEFALRANDLLLWFSARGEGSWRQFRRAVDELYADEAKTGEDVAEFPLHQQLRLNFENLAHVEFRAHQCERGWRVTPPTLAAHVTRDGIRSVLCGARSPDLRERLVDAAKNLNYEVLSAKGIPDVFRFTSLNGATLADITAQVGIIFQRDAPMAILSNLPPSTPPSRSESPQDFPVGDEWIIHQFDAGEGVWRKTERRQLEALRFGVLKFSSTFQRDRYFLRWKGLTFERPRAIAIYALLRHRRRRVLSYDPAIQTLSLPAICRPPRLVERSLALCSGFPPAYDNPTSTLKYYDVPLQIAQFTAELLRQPLL
jgi:hypothetical protein